MDTRTVTLNGTEFTIPDDELKDPHPDQVGFGWQCPSRDGATHAVCTVADQHDDAVMHIAHDGEGNVIAMWDAAHGWKLEAAR
jgi:hypothetical protein